MKHVIYHHLSFKLVELGLLSSNSKQFTHIAAVKINENSLLEEKKKQLDSDICFLHATMRLFLVSFFLYKSSIQIKHGYYFSWTKKMGIQFLELGGKKIENIIAFCPKQRLELSIVMQVERLLNGNEWVKDASIETKNTKVN